VTSEKGSNHGATSFYLSLHRASAAARAYALERALALPLIEPTTFPADL